MPFVGGREDDYDYDGSLFPGRKRRWDGADGNRIFRLYSPEQQVELYPDGGSARKIIPLSKRARIAAPAAADENDDEDRRRQDEACLQGELELGTAHWRRFPQMKVVQDQTGPGNRPVCPRSSSALLAPCHICHRKPTKKSDLDSFAGCEGCGRRTCFVCIRECHGWPADQVEALLLEQAVLSQSFRMDGIQESPQFQPLQRPPPSPPPPLDTTAAAAATTATPQPPAALPQRASVDGQRPGARDTGGSCRDDSGWDASCHKSVVCSRCCVEKGRQGEVVCLGCLTGLPGA
ncbi:hypothetical protein HIM_02377 [Hirsutella minnesotensis 3608]|nr:hypothetical protein HIM_02377 [Hirsutella minnesotensis 3608]